MLRIKNDSETVDGTVSYLHNLVQLEVFMFL